VKDEQLPPIAELLPQGPSFRFLDSILHYGHGIVVAQRFVRPDDPVFEDHFPGSPIYPGVLLIEMMAQAASLIIRIAAYNKSGITPKPGAIGKIKTVSFLNPVRPGDMLAISAEQGLRFAHLSEFKCSITRGAEKLVAGTLVLSEWSPTQ